MRTLTHGRTMTAAVVMGILMATELRAAEPRRARVTSDQAPVPRHIVVSIPDRKLAVVENGRVLRFFDVAVGAPASPSPVGTFAIVSRIPNPTYYAPGKVVPPGPRNPLGTRWMGLSIKGYGIHGTDNPRSIGHNRSHGCIRLRNADVEQLFDLVRDGDIVELLGEPLPVVAADVPGLTAQGSVGSGS